jgi:hypothetical protein
MGRSVTRCVVCTAEREAHAGYLCRGHLEKLGAMLRDIEEEAVRLSVHPSMAVTYDKAGGDLASQQWPVRPDPLVLRDPRRKMALTEISEADELAWDDTPSVLHMLNSWARLVREERELAIPERITVVSERDLLSRQLDWIADQEWVDEFHDDLSGLLNALRRANNTLMLPVGKCETYQPDGSACDGKVWHIMIKPDGTVERGSASADPKDEPGFRCGSCRRVWTGTEAVRLRDRMWRDEQERKAAG